MPATLRVSKSKYGNVGVRTEEGYFASKRELAHWLGLKDRERAGEISDLRRQVRIDVYGANGKKVCVYVADAVHQENGEEVICDSKGYRTPTYRLKKKLLAAMGFTIVES